MQEPAWLSYARKQIGIREIPGPRHEPRIMAMVKRTARFLGITVRDDETAWCGTLAADVMLTGAGIAPPRIAVRAKSWASWGTPLAAPVPGAVLVFERQGGGHVGFAVGQSATHYFVLGGNQSNSVNIAPIAKNRCVAIRWPNGVPVPAGKLPTMSMAGQVVSTNEA